MINRALSIAFPAVFVTGLWMLGPSAAHADLEACGGIFLSGDAECGYRPKQECMTECMTSVVETACVTQVYAGCESSCTTTASTECESSCTSSCMDKCTTTTTTEQGPTCMDLCLSDCEDEGDDSYCGSTSRRSACGRCAKHTCESRCEEKCGDASEQVKVKSATECSATCSNACSASCTAKVNTQCQVDCQEGMYTSCEQKMVETCQTQCKDKGGAIFCDGQFVNASNAQSCADEVKAKIDIDIDIKGAVEDVGNTVDEATDDACKSVNESCSVRDAGAATGSALSVLCPLGALALWRLRRRRPRR